MKKIIRASDDNSDKYIGGELYGLPEDFWDDEDLSIGRFDEQNEYIENFSSAYIIYRPKMRYDKFEVRDSDYLLADLTEGMAINDGINVIAYPDHIDVIAYDGSYKETAYLYPISSQKANELYELLEDADFDESTVIENEIAQYVYNGASVEDILKSWR